ncbi:MAG: hypothetical protein ACYS21_11220 [Planctomycetota bacterium]|jgi:hypothetical protein
MNDKKDERWLDELIRRTINSGQPRFDAAGWKEEYSQEYEILKSRAREPSGLRTNASTLIPKSRIAKFAAASVIIVAIGFVIVHQVSRKQTEGQAVMEAAKSPAEMLTSASLTMAYRQGGLEEVEKQCEKAFEMLGPRRTSISVEQLMKELDGG